MAKRSTMIVIFLIVQIIYIPRQSNLLCECVCVFSIQTLLTRLSILIMTTINRVTIDHSSLINPLQAKFLPQKWSFQALNKLVLSPVDYSQCIGQV